MNEVQMAVALETGVAADDAVKIIKYMATAQASTFKALLDKYDVDGDVDDLIAGTILIFYNAVK